MAATESNASRDCQTGDLRIRLRKSTNRRLAKHRACVAGLGLRRIGDEVCLPDRPEIRGMVNRVRYLLEVEEIAPAASTAKVKPRAEADLQVEAHVEADVQAGADAEVDPDAKADVDLEVDQHATE